MFLWENKKKIFFSFWLKKVPYLELCFVVAFFFFFFSPRKKVLLIFFPHANYIVGPP